MTLSRDPIITALRAALEPLEYVNAMWLAGSSAMGAEDALSDIDAVLDVADGRHNDAFLAAEAGLEALASIELRVIVPEPAWHGHSQRVYRLKGCPEHLMVDLCVMQRSTTAPRFDEREIHGEPVILFDKLGVIKAVPVDKDAHRRAMKERILAQKTRFALLCHQAGKEVLRGNELDALWRYQNLVLLPLIGVLRTRYAPMFHDFAPRYLKRDLPPDVYARLMDLSFVAGPHELAAKIAEAIAWADQEFASLDVDAILL